MPCNRITWIFFLFLKSLKSTEKLTSDEMSITAHGLPVLSIKRRILSRIRKKKSTLKIIHLVIKITIDVVCRRRRFYLCMQREQLSPEKHFRINF